MNKKGFTMVEILAVIIILGILSTVAIVEVSRYRRMANSNELINLRSTIEDCYNSYRQDTIITGGSPKYDISITDRDILNKYFNELTYDGNRLDLTTASVLSFSLKTKGDLLNNTCYKSVRNPSKYVEDKTCLIEHELTEDNNLINKCVEGPKPSKDQVLCIDLTINDNELFTDSDDGYSNLCFYFTHADETDCTSLVDTDSIDDGETVDE